MKHDSSSSAMLHFICVILVVGLGCGSRSPCSSTTGIDSELSAFMMEFSSARTEVAKRVAAEQLSTRMMQLISRKKPIPIKYIVKKLGPPDVDSSNGLSIGYIISTNECTTTYLSIKSSSKNSIQVVSVSVMEH